MKQRYEEQIEQMQKEFEDVARRIKSKSDKKTK